MVRALDVAVTPALAQAREPADIAVVLDVLRATTTIATALENGAAAVIPVREQDQAIAIRGRLGRDGVLLGGERDSRLIAGFDLDNSPGSYARELVAGKTIVLTTTNGTRALTEAARGRTVVYCGALINRSAVVAALTASNAAEALLICAGELGTLSFEDFVAAGAIVEGLLRADKRIALSDAARSAACTYEAVARKLTTAIAGGTHARALIELGFAGDVAYCAKLDVTRALPRYADGRITAADRP